MNLQPEPPNLISTEKFHHMKCSIWAVALEMRRTSCTFNLHPTWKCYHKSYNNNLNLMNLQPEPPNLISTEKFHHIKCNILSSCIGNAQNIMNLQPSPHLKVLPQKLQQQPEPPNSISTEKFHHIKCSIWAVALEMRRTLWTFTYTEYHEASNSILSLKCNHTKRSQYRCSFSTVALCSLEENLSFKVNFTVKISVHY